MKNCCRPNFANSAAEKIYSAVGYEFNLRSGAQLSKAVFEDLPKAIRWNHKLSEPAIP